MIDSATAAEIGKMLGVEAIIVGTVADMGDSVDLRARLVDVEKGAAITAAQIAVNKNPTITKILSNGVREAIYGKGGIVSIKEAKSMHKVNIQNFSCKLIDWQKKGGGIYFEILITSDQDSKLRLFGGNYPGEKTRFFDDFGNEYFSNKIQLGNFASSRDVGNTLVAGVPMKVIVSFDNISPDTKNLTLFEIRCYATQKDFSVQFRNIPIVQ